MQDGRSVLKVVIISLQDTIRQTHAGQRHEFMKETPHDKEMRSLINIKENVVDKDLNTTLTSQRRYEV